MSRVPVRSEGEAFRFVLLTVLAFAATAVASLLGGVAAGVPVWAVATVCVASAYLFGGGRRQLRTAPPHHGPPEERRVLVVATGDVDGGRIAAEIEAVTAGHSRRVLVVSPAVVSGLRRWVSDVDRGREQAQQRLAAWLAALQAAGIAADGQIGDGDPLQAIEDALRSFGADQIIFSEPAQTRRGKPSLTARADQRYALPITQV